MSAPVPDDAPALASITQRLLDLCLALASTRPLGDVLDLILDATTDLVGCDRASMLLYDGATEQLRFVASTSEETEALARIPVPLDGSLAGTIFRERRPVVAGDVRQDTRHFEAPGEALGYRPRAIGGVPLLVGDEAIGVLEALDPHAGAFTERDIEVLAAVAAQAAVAVHASRERHAAERAHARLDDRDRLHTALLDAAARELSDASANAAADAARLAAVAAVLDRASRHTSAPSRREVLVWQDVLRACLDADAVPLLDLCDGPLSVHADAGRLTQVLHLVMEAAHGADGPAVLDVCADCDDGQAQAEVRGPALRSLASEMCLAAAALVAERDGATVWIADGAVFVALPMADEATR